MSSDEGLFIWEDSTWIKKNGKPQVLLFGRSVNNHRNTTITVVDGFEPYFYCPADARAIPSEIKRVDRPFTDAFGRPVWKCVTILPSDIPKIRSAFDWTDEADVLFDKRFVVDRHIKYGYRVDQDGRVTPHEVSVAVPPRVCYFDIEVKSPPETFPVPEKAEWPIVSIQVMDSYDKRPLVFTWGVPKIADDQVVAKTEADLFDLFIEFIQRTNPDVLSGWFTNGFDLPYIVKRAERLGVKLCGLTRSPDGWNTPQAEKRGQEWSIRIMGRQCFDMYPAFKKWYKAEGELEAYDLKTVSKVFAKFEYQDYGARIQELFDKGEWETFLQYCRNDTIALQKIDEEIKLIDFYENLRMTVGIKLEETLMNSRMIESLLMRSGMKPMPTRTYGKTSEGYSGALVLTPKIGIHNNVAVYDLAALYPTIIIGFNVSPDVDKMIPKVIGTMINEREKLRALRMSGTADDTVKKKETVLKFIVNSFYGVLGWPGFRMYTPEMAEFITTTGREINVFLQDTAKRAGKLAIYGDTDSVFITGINTIEAGKELQETFNSNLVEWALGKGMSQPPVIKFEKFYRRILFKKSSGSEDAAKKRYAGHITWKDGFVQDKLDFTGIELKRSDQAKITKIVLKSFLEAVLKEDDEPKAIEVVKRAVQAVLAGQVIPYDVSIPRGIKDMDRNDPWTRGTRNTYSLYGIHVLTGVKPRLLYVKGSIKEICLTEEMDKALIESRVQVDWVKMCNKVIEHKMRSFVESLGIQWQRAINGQQGLEEWF